MPRDLIERKRRGEVLSPDEWSGLASAYLRGEVPDYQMAALLMAVVWRGMDREETGALTRTMLQSGARFDLSHIGRPRVDKHSTGGVGDKASLVLAPMVASCGVAVPMISGRGLGHTGGTLDKLESIPGFRTDLTLHDATLQLERLGCVLMGQTGEVAPLDRRLYALRDATATVESAPLIAASIMSKKLAEDLTGLVLDVKYGSGAFLQHEPDGIELAEVMIELGASTGCPVTALLTAMDRPLGRACGNALEVEEAVLALRGEGPADLMDVTFALGAEMLLLAGVVDDEHHAREQLERSIGTGAAASLFQRVIEAQGGNPGVVDDPAVLPQAEVSAVFEAPSTGVVSAVAPREVGKGITALGGGRRRMSDEVDPSVGFVITAMPGNPVERGEPLATVYARDENGLRAGLAALDRAIQVAEPGSTVRPLPLIGWRVTASGVERLA